jgi:hypothetical protein
MPGWGLRITDELFAKVSGRDYELVKIALAVERENRDQRRNFDKKRWRSSASNGHKAPHPHAR